MYYDVIIVGSGPSGLAAAATLIENNLKVLVVEKQTSIGIKLRATGGGRCNVTNNLDPAEFLNDIEYNKNFVKSLIYRFNTSNVINMIEKLGVPLKLENNFKYYPKSDNAYDIINAFASKIGNKNFLLNTEIVDIKKSVDHFQLTTSSKQILSSKYIILACGGCSYPQLGGSQTSYYLATKLKHELTELSPSEAPIYIKEKEILEKLQGVSLSNCTVMIVTSDNKIVGTKKGDIIFTHFGLSGPAAIWLSEVVKNYKKTKLVINHIGANSQQYYSHLLKLRNKYPNYKLYKLLEIRPRAYKDILLGHYKDLDISVISNENLNIIANNCCNFTLTPTHIGTFHQGFVTAGGIKTDDINNTTMESKLVPNLYIVGEMLDIHGHTGGYNITLALASGVLAGRAISRK